MKGIFVFLSTALFCAHTFAADVATAPIVNVKYIHEYIKQKWDISVAYNPALSNQQQAANMRYLLSAVDVANHILNGFTPIDSKTGRPVTYGDGEYATRAAANTTTAVRAIDTLISKIEFPFWVIPETSENEFIINMAAAGTFYIDWGDGVVERWIKDATPADISHTYDDAAQNHTIHIGGTPTRYPLTQNGAIWFGNEDSRRHVRAVGGCLGCLFHTIDDGTQAWQQPQFRQTFHSNKLLTEIPSGFFDGFHGIAINGMFVSTFYDSGLIEFPKDLFGQSQLVPSRDMFFTFCENCTSLTHIPENMFLNISGDATDKESIFFSTFKGCSALKNIPVNLFGQIENINKPSVFQYMFYNATAVSGELAPMLNGKYVWQWWPDWRTQMLYWVPLDNWAEIPEGWR